MTGTGTRRTRSVGRPARLVKDQILDAVEELGIDTFTIKAVADRLGVRDSTVYNYIQSREGLRADTAARALARVPLRFDEVPGWVDYLIEVNRHLRDAAAALPGLAEYYLHGPYAAQSIEVFDTQIAQVQDRLPGAGESYAFVLASHASTTTLSFFSAFSADSAAEPADTDATHVRVLQLTLPALHRALDGRVPNGIDWPRIRATIRQSPIATSAQDASATGRE